VDRSVSFFCARVRRALVACLCFRAAFVVAVGSLHGSRKENNAGNFCEEFSPRKSVEALCSCVNYFAVFFLFSCLSLSLHSELLYFLCVDQNCGCQAFGDQC
jgi:hypothetical protein